MLEVIRTQDIFHQYVINVHFHYTPDQILKDLVNHALEGGPSVFEPEGHHLVAIKFSTSSKSSLVFIWWVHLTLVILGVGVYEAEKFMARYYLYQLIDSREGKAILWASFIEASEVDADPPLAILLLHEDEIGEPFVVECLSDEAGW